ncbi:Trafficking protein particle complex subunit, partial [Ooceraea biroi]
WRFRLKNRFLLSPVSGLKKWQRKEGECKDINTYKTSVGDDIDAWLKILHLYHIQDWMIILVETYDVKKANKLLPRTTVLDKIRSDFAAKTADRCFAVINPIKSESRSAESWRGLITIVYRYHFLCILKKAQDISHTFGFTHTRRHYRIPTTQYTTETLNSDWLCYVKVRPTGMANFRIVTYLKRDKDTTCRVKPTKKLEKSALKALYIRNSYHPH